MTAETFMHINTLVSSGAVHKTNIWAEQRIQRTHQRCWYGETIILKRIAA